MLTKLNVSSTPFSRREMLCHCFNGVGAIALSSFLAKDGWTASGNSLAAKPPMIPAKAKRCIFLYMSGGVPQMDTFDYKPALEKYAGQPMPQVTGVEGTEIERYLRMPNVVIPSPFPFARVGKNGRYMSTLFEHLKDCVDDLAFVHGVKMDSNNHAPATMHVNTGSVFQTNPSVGAWVTYGLGTVNQNLPGYVVLQDPRGGPLNGEAVWQSGFLPASYQGTSLRRTGTPILALNLPPGQTRERERMQLDFLYKMNESHAAARLEADELEARIAAYELAFRMQTEAPEVVDSSKEPQYIQRLYGLDKPETAPFGKQCLLARRLVEKGVRFVLAIHGWENGALSWDFHSTLAPRLQARVREVDQPVTALLKDLKQRGLFEDTLVVWVSEMGRTPFNNLTIGRNHNQYGMVTWFAGAGIKGGAEAGGPTDDFGLKSAHAPIPVRDVHATLLHQLGLDDKALTFLHEGRYKRLTDTGGSVLNGILV